MEPVTVYIKMDKNILVNKRNIKMQDIAKVYSSDKKVVNKINEIVVLNINAKRKHLYIFSVLKLFEEIHKICPNADMENIGEADFIIQFEPPKKKSQLLEFGKIAFVGLIIFFGAAFTIMSFNEDINVKDLFSNLYQVVGVDKSSLALEVAYAIGIPVGIVVFFNHFSKIKLTNDPTPMQVQLRLYEENLDKAIVENANRKDTIIDSK